MQKPRLLDIRKIQKRVGVFCLLAFAGIMFHTQAQTIKGDVYGGGNVGNLGEDGQEASPVVTISGGTTVRTVFGGGLNGTVSGSTTVNILGGTVGAAEYSGTATGGVYGGGEGSTATVSGDATVYIAGGEVVNNVYGGGKMAALNGNATVEIAGGRMKSDVYAGARAADINGFAYAYVHFRSLVRSLFGGNDIGGEIRNANKASGDCPAYYSGVLQKAKQMPLAFIRIASGDAPASGDALAASYPLFIANVYGGGNGDYTYTDLGGYYTVELPNASGDAPTTFKVNCKPDLGRTFLDISGGTFYNVFGGGNKATITGAADIYLHEDNTYAPATLAAADRSWMPSFDAEAYTGSTDITFNRQLYHLFGGNNLATMAIRPDWHLTSGTVHNVYSGGNKGAMTYPTGIILSVNGEDMAVDNVYGGCRLADVRPMNGGADVTSIPSETFDGYEFPEGYSARVRIRGGKIGNVYGGNDIAGNVYFGTNVVIESNIISDVYGAGNGSYAYTDKTATSDYYYDSEGATGTASIRKLNNFRPNSEKTLISLLGRSGNPTYIGGAVYCGGNSATLRSTSGNMETGVNARLEIGSYVIAHRVFLGSNGANMLDDGIVEHMNSDFNSADLRVKEQFDEYMKAVDVAVVPGVSFTTGYQDGTSRIGSFYCGGNVGSMTADGTFSIDFLNKLVLFEKLVAGCNNANVAKTSLHANHMGGLTGAPDPTTGVKVKLDIDGLQMEPQTLTYNASTGTFSTDWSTYTEEGKPNYRFLKGGNVYGGCYESGYVNGGVEINLMSDLLTNAVKDHFGVPGNTYDWDNHSSEQSVSALSVYGGGYGTETEIWGNVSISLLDDVHVLKVRGGGEMGWVGRMTRDADGRLTEGTPYTLYAPDGTHTSLATKQVTDAYNATVTMNANLMYRSSAIFPNVGDICAGGLQGVVTGNTTVRLKKGCAYKVFGGAANADVYGGTEVFIEGTAPLYVTRTVYGGNDFGGQVMGTLIHQTNNTETGSIQRVKSNTYVEYLKGEIGYNTGEAATAKDVSYGIMGASFGGYDYDNHKYDGLWETKPNLLARLTTDAGCDLAVNSFVNVASSSTDRNDKVYTVYGGGEGLSGKMGYADTYNTYVLLNAQNKDKRGTGNYLTNYVYGGGNCSKTAYTLSDVYKGYARSLFGGCHGSSDKSQSLSYMGESTTVNLYGTLSSDETDIFGAGALSGAKETFVNVYGGTVHNVYGSTYQEGITYQSNVSVPANSKAVVNAVFGGGKGLSLQDACDTYISVIDFNSSNARVQNAIYGGNDSCRMTRNAFINITVPVRSSADTLVNVYGAGFGPKTMASQTRVNLTGTASGDARVGNVYGGGCNGVVFNAPTLAKFLRTKDYYATDGDDATTYLTDGEVAGFNTWLAARTAAGTVLTDGLTYAAIEPLSLNDETTSSLMNTTVLIPNGVEVSKNAFGGGYGSNATVVGQTDVQLLGGDVSGNIYGGGEGGSVAMMKDYPLSKTQNISTNVTLAGGTTTNSYGGGLNGSVVGTANTYVGRSGCNSAVVTFLDGDPTVERSLYGGGEKGLVHGTANLYIRNGHIGFYYDALTDGYYENLNLPGRIDTLLYQNGNVFGGGYGEGAYVIDANVWMYGGTIRNSLYGGGEIASVGYGSVKKSTDGSNNQLFDRTKDKCEGHARLYVYGGNIQRDVFGGGRGFSYDLTGQEVVGKRIYTDGYVFGSTDVQIYGGTIGTDDNVKSGYGNVFGGGNVGFVYSVAGYRATDTEDDKTIGYYYTNPEAPAKPALTEDTRVVISPYCLVTAAGGVTINGHTYQQCEYVPTSDLNYLKKTDPEWNSIDWRTGVTVKNAVFAGGNVSRGSDKLYANTTTIYGNATATLNDIYHRDLITVGSDYVGGLYGDGNLTLVDGYREIAIVNYGTDYYSLSDNISIDEYNKLSDRERAYFTLKYRCKTAYGSYKVGDQIDNETYNGLSDAEKANWEQAGFCTIYAGRLLNTVQRADFCGVHGSRIVLQGAQDRTVDEVDYTYYSINRVGEVSLNKRNSLISADTGDEARHGNYFGMYNVVNFLRALTSDVRFDTAIRYSKNGTFEVDKSNGYVDQDNRTYKAFKQAHLDDSHRNNGTSDNKIAMAQGVYLEIVDSLAVGTETDPLTGYKYKADEKVYGPITGVIELDLINASPELGGGYVYAQNIHGTPTFDPAQNEQLTLSDYNDGAITKKAYTYTAHTSSTSPLQTSGNFVHHLKQIVDDCYPTNNDLTAPAHYWYLRGSIFVYEQVISAFTGAATSYKAEATLPLTITAGAHGKLRVMDVQANRYAYYKEGTTKLGDDETIRVNNVTYSLNDVIDYWTWSNLPAADQDHFVQRTYVCKNDFMTGKDGTGTTILKGYVMLEPEYNGYMALDSLYDLTGTSIPKRDALRISNATSHDNGYILTADVTNPMVWNDRYIKRQDTGTAKTIFDTDGYNAAIAARTISADDYAQGPSFTTSLTGVYGQRLYYVDDILPKEIHDTYEGLGADKPKKNQATVEKGYVSTRAVTFITSGGNERSIGGSGVAISETEYAHLGTSGQTSKQSAFEPAYVCITTFEPSGRQAVLYGTLYPKSSWDTIGVYQKYFSEAYICSKDGLYGGQKYESGWNYEALSSYNAISDDDKSKFAYNFDAFDLIYNDLDNASWTGGYSPAQSYGNLYLQQQAIAYQAKCHEAFTYTPKGGAATTVEKGTLMTNLEFDNIPNEKAHYSKVTVTTGGETVYIVHTQFIVGSTYYNAGQTVTEAIYNDHTDKVSAITIPNPGVYYYCFEAYTVGEKGEGVKVKNVLNNTEYTAGVPAGILITQSNYADLKNYQKNFTISGVSPVETSSLYVPRMAEIQDHTKERIITLIYQYQYEETSDDGTETEQVAERHVVNIHIQFKTGIPTIGELTAPSMVLPGSTVGLKQPNIIDKGAYESMGGGWEVYRTKADAENHVNGIAYANNHTPMYFYEDGYYVAYYTKTYLGKTYSNAVPFSVANYHTIDGVLADKEHHLYVDNPDNKRNCKIYIADKAASTDPSKNEIDLLSQLFTLCSTGLDGHSDVDDHIRNGRNLDILLSDDVKPRSSWTQAGNAGACFEGDLHGDGHTISGLDKSLFSYFCGDVYNLGLTGTFNGAGLSDNGDGRAYNCWLMTTGTPTKTTYPFFGSGGGIVDNCYYNAAYKDPSQLTVWSAHRKSEAAFNNGEVSYNLNKFYLNKRYSDGIGGIRTNAYSYYTIDPADNTALVLHDKSDDDDCGHYMDGEAPFSYTDINGNTYPLGYVEYRFVNGDFLYAGGSIPTDVNERLDKDNIYYPIYPDDYLFFGQLLSYNLTGNEKLQHQETPAVLNRKDGQYGRMVTDTVSSNRVYRSPAYFGSSTKSSAYFNTSAALPSTYTHSVSTTTTTVTVDPTITETRTFYSEPVVVVNGRVTTTTVVKTTETDGLDTRVVDTIVTVGTDKDAYLGLTALDLSKVGDYGYSRMTDGYFYPPLTDYEGLIGFNNKGQTQNMLVYADKSGDATSYGKLDEYFYEPELTLEPSHGSNTVDTLTSDELGKVKGHLVNRSSSSSQAEKTQLLVDRQEFNAPFEYTFDSGDRMWYQRKPDYYATLDNGSDAVSLPFEAKTVTTQTKGEITHFYQSSEKGHEYWLREYEGVDELQSTASEVCASFDIPAKGTEGIKEYANTFLWDYYYSFSADANQDDYFVFYRDTNYMDDYAYAQPAVPYLLGLPGSSYYEFDLSGSFEPKNIKGDIEKLDPQHITWISAEGATIDVSDDELSSAAVSAGGYLFQSNYGRQSVPAGAFMLNADGSGFDVTTEAQPAVPFRPYFTTAGPSPAPGVQRIFFSPVQLNKGSSLDPMGGIDVWASKSRIVVRSRLESDRTVTIVNASGMTVARFNLTPGSTVSTSIQSPGVYLVAGHKVLVN